MNKGSEKETTSFGNKTVALEEKRGLVQGVFDEVLEGLLGSVDHKILAAGVVAYRRAKEAALVLYPVMSQPFPDPHVSMQCLMCCGQ